MKEDMLVPRRSTVSYGNVLMYIRFRYVAVKLIAKDFIHLACCSHCFRSLTTMFPALWWEMSPECRTVYKQIEQVKLVVRCSTKHIFLAVKSSPLRKQKLDLCEQARISNPSHCYDETFRCQHVQRVLPASFYRKETYRVLQNKLGRKLFAVCDQVVERYVKTSNREDRWHNWCDSTE